MHTIQLIAKTGLSPHSNIEKIIPRCGSIATHLHHSTTQLAKIQDRLQVPKLSVVHDKPTRRNYHLNHPEKNARNKGVTMFVCCYTLQNQTAQQYRVVDNL